MSQLDASGMTDRPAELDAYTFSQLRSSLIRALRAAPAAREPLCDALELLDAIQLKAEEKGRDQSALRPSPPAQARGQRYQVQRTAEGEFLVEERPGQSQPFRCPRPAYEAASQVMSEAEDALHFDELMERLNVRLGERQPDYRLRVALRFWIARGIVSRFRTRYRAAAPAGFIESASSQWRKLAGEEDVRTPAGPAAPPAPA